jgi:hypothetical protein
MYAQARSNVCGPSKLRAVVGGDALRASAKPWISARRLRRNSLARYPGYTLRRIGSDGPGCQTSTRCTAGRPAALLGRFLEEPRPRSTTPAPVPIGSDGPALNGARRAHKAPGCRLQRGAPLDGLGKIPGCVRPLRPPVRIGSDGPACQLQPRAPLDGLGRSPAALLRTVPGRARPRSTTPARGSDRTAPAADFNQVHRQQKWRCSSRSPEDPRPRCFGRFPEDPRPAFDHSGPWFGSDGPGCRLQPGAPLDGPGRAPAALLRTVPPGKIPGRVHHSGPGSDRTAPAADFNQVHRPGKIPAAFDHSGPWFGSDGPGCQLQRGAPLDGLGKIPGCVRPLRPRFGSVRTVPR